MSKRDTAHREIDYHHNVWLYEGVWRLTTWHQSLRGWRTSTVYLADQPHYTSPVLADRWRTLDFREDVTPADFATHSAHCGCPECDTDTRNDDAAIAAHESTMRHAPMTQSEVRYVRALADAMLPTDPDDLPF